MTIALEASLWFAAESAALTRKTLIVLVWKPVRLAWVAVPASVRTGLPPKVIW